MIACLYFDIPRNNLYYVRHSIELHFLPTHTLILDKTLSSVEPKPETSLSQAIYKKHCFYFKKILEIFMVLCLCNSAVTEGHIYIYLNCDLKYMD